jgi:ABC-type transport system involved in multi-copper enzyme maturation permease subunit
VTQVFRVCLDLLREAASRKWFLGLFLSVTLFLCVLGLSLRMDVVDGALSGVTLFGRLFDDVVLSVDVALRPVFAAATAILFFGGTLFLILACADFGPELFAPGRIEHLLSLPVRRWQLLLGTFLGVLLLAAACALYGAGGFVLILGVKTGVWTVRPVLGALLSVVSFAAIYGVMLAVPLYVRSAALSVAVGFLFFVSGIIASFREQLGALFEAGLPRETFEAVTIVLPRLGALGVNAIRYAGAQKVDPNTILAISAGCILYAAAGLMVGVWRFERKDF